MLINEKNDFIKMLIKLFTIYDKTPDPEVYDLWFSIMVEYDYKTIQLAFTDYAKNEKYPPVPAGVINYMPKPKEISADEAWAHIPRSEGEGAWLNQRMANALSQVSGMNDQIAARKSFIAAYNNLTDDNQWFYSPATGINYDQQLETKQFLRKQLEAKQWISEADEKQAPLMISGFTKTQIESNKKRVSELLSIIGTKPTNESK